MSGETDMAITQRTLSQLMKKRSAVEAANREIKQLEDSLLQRLKAGETVRPGLFAARVKEWTRRNVPWKQVLIREKGEEFADRVFNATKPDNYEALVVEAAG
jgi:hypothetical protein